VRYDGSTAAAVMKAVCQKLRSAIENEGRAARIEGTWWEFALTARSEKEPSAVSLLKISRDKRGALELTGRAWQEDGTLSGRYWSEAVKERENGSGIFWYWKGERPLHPDAPQLEGTGEMRLESVDRASGYFTTRVEAQNTNARTAGVFLRAEPIHMSILDGQDNQKRVELIAERLRCWKSMKST
jgi:hypothetical protein